MLSTMCSVTMLLVNVALMLLFCLQGSQQWRENNRDLSKQKVGSQLSAMNAATAQVVTLTSADADETDYTAVGSAVQNM